MDPETEVRMECLRLAAANASPDRDTVATAEAFYGFVTRRGAAGYGPRADILDKSAEPTFDQRAYRHDRTTQPFRDWR